MAAGAISQETWRVVFGDNQEWMAPQVECPANKDDDAARRATWRVVFGNTAAWLPPQLDIPPLTPENAGSERCELCRQAIADGEDFVTNSAGQRFTHTRCPGVPSTTGADGKPQSHGWLGVLCGLLRHQPNG